MRFSSTAAVAGILVLSFFETPMAKTEHANIKVRATVKRQAPGTTGDNHRKISTRIPGLDISEEECPIFGITYPAGDAGRLELFGRYPRVPGPFPTILFFHGGGGKMQSHVLRKGVQMGTVQTRFLRRGYAVFQSTRRSMKKPGGRGGFEKAKIDSAVMDCIRAVEAVRALPKTDPQRVYIYGGSGGGCMAIQTAGKTPLAGIIVGEPATVLFAGMMTRGKRKGGDRGTRKERWGSFSPEARDAAASVVGQVTAPTLFLEGGVSRLSQFNGEHIIPLFRELKVPVKAITYEGMRHGFYWGEGGATTEVIDRIVSDVESFIKGI